MKYAKCCPNKKHNAKGLCIKHYGQLLRSKPGYIRDKSLLERYGIRSVDYDFIFKAQEGVCAICKCPPKQKYLAVDHDHKTGRVRGLLCDLCNAFLGKADVNINVLTNVAIYKCAKPNWELI